MNPREGEGKAAPVNRAFLTLLISVEPTTRGNNMGDECHSESEIRLSQRLAGNAPDRI